MELDDNDDALQQRLSLIEDNAWVALSTAGGVELVLGNLLAALDGRDGFNAAAFTTDLQARLQLMPLRPTLRLGAQGFLERLQAFFAARGAPGGAPPGTLFH